MGGTENGVHFNAYHPNCQDFITDYADLFTETTIHVCYV
jgi:hypothetical protein